MSTILLKLLTSGILLLRLKRIVPELEILTILLDHTLNFVTLIGRPQWNGRFFLAGELVSPAAEI